MNRIKIGLAVTVLLGALYAAAGLFQSLGQFGLGIAIASAAAIAYGLVNYLEAERDAELARRRAEVWARRDYEYRNQL